MTAPAERLAWVDACRFLAAIGIVLIHATADFAGQPFTTYTSAERVGPMLLRVIADFSSSEIFFTFSMFLVAFKLDRRPLGYGAFNAEQAKRLLIPFLAWTLFYAFYRLIKAYGFNYGAAIVAELQQPASWLQYLLLGSAQYHMHFLPTLFALGLFLPVMQAAVRYPLLGLAIVPLLGGMDAVQGMVWSNVSDPMLRDYLVRAVKILGYTGYGFAAFALYGVWKRGIPREDSGKLATAVGFLLVFIMVVNLVYISSVIQSGQWGSRTGWPFYAYFLTPVLVLTLFMSLQHRAWSPAYVTLARYAFGIYLLHPIFIDLCDIAIFRLGLSLPATILVLIRFAFAASCAFLLSMAMVRNRSLAWLIGAGPLPQLFGRHRPATADERAR